MDDKEILIGGQIRSIDHEGDRLNNWGAEQKKPGLQWKPKYPPLAVAPRHCIVSCFHTINSSSETLWGFSAEIQCLNVFLLCGGLRSRGGKLG